ncbi:MAG: ornithine decarboxylase [Rhodobacteraceae bacterium]|nr:ornithine decarboxylase [Paracoccaceae bacterium]
MKACALAVDRFAAAHVASSRAQVAFEDLCSVDGISALVIGTTSHIERARALARLAIPPVPVVLVAPADTAQPAVDDGLTVLDPSELSPDAVAATVERLAAGFEDARLPPFFTELARYRSRGTVTFACPGHQGAHFLDRHPVGRAFLDFVGRDIFRMDVPHADPALGDMTGREGPPAEAEALAADVFGADRTFFVLNGTSSSNKIVATALLTPGDLVLFDRNNHKSCYNGMLALSGAQPIYLEAARNDFGLIGGVPARCFDEALIRERLRKLDPARADLDRPFRLAAFQLGTWDGTIYNVHEIISRIGHLCDYVLFDAAWVGYEQFLPLLDAASPLRMPLGPQSPGIIVTQSVHKQLSGFSQTSQIHIRDSHRPEADRRRTSMAFKAALMIHGTTSPFYPLFTSLEVNARLHGAVGHELWQETVERGIEARKRIFETCAFIAPFVPPSIEGIAWHRHPTPVIAHDSRFFSFEERATWHGFGGYGEGLQMLDPCKLLLVTHRAPVIPGRAPIRIPTNVIAAFLREHGLIPEKSDLYSMVFLLTPGTTEEKLDRLVDLLAAFEAHVRANTPLGIALPSLHAANPDRYAGGLGDLCARLDEIYAANDVPGLLRSMFEDRHLPTPVLSVQEAHGRLVRGEVEMVPLGTAAGRIAAEGALPYPPGPCRTSRHGIMASRPRSTPRAVTVCWFP